MGMKEGSEPIRVLLVDDNRTVLWGLSKLIQSEWPRMSLSGMAQTRARALNLARVHPDVILLDLNLDGEYTVNVLPELLRRSGGRALIYTGVRDLHLHRDAIQCGAMGIVEKGTPAEVILDAIECVYRGHLWNRGFPDAFYPQRSAKLRV
jgi:two-component system nitrate/nitrite response regulator NarL